MFLGCLWLFVYLAIRIPVYCQGGFDTGRIYGYPVQTPQKYAGSVVSVVDHFHIIESTSVDPYHTAHQDHNLYYPDPKDHNPYHQAYQSHNPYYPAPQGQNPFHPAPQAPQDHNQNTGRFFSRDPEFNNFLDSTIEDTEYFSIRMLDDSLMSITANFGDKHSPSQITRTLTLGPKLSKVVVSKWLHLFREVAEDKMLNKNLKKKWFNNAFDYLESLNGPDNKAEHKDDIRDLLKLLKRTKGSKHLYEELRSIKINKSKKSTNLLHQKETKKKKIKVKKKYEDSTKKLKSKTNKRKIKDSKQKGKDITSKSDSLSDSLSDSESDKEPERKSKNESEEQNSYDKEDKDYEDNVDYDEYDSSEETSDKSNEESEESSDDNEYKDGDYDDIEADNYSDSEDSDSEESDSDDSDSHNDYNLDTSLFRMSKPGKPDKPGLSDYYLPEFHGKPMVTSSMIKEMEIQFKSEVVKFSVNLSGFPISNTTNDVSNTTLSKSLPTTLSKSLPTTLSKSLPTTLSKSLPTTLSKSLPITPSSSITTHAAQSSHLSTSSTTVSTSSKAIPSTIKEVSTSSKLVSTSGKAVPTSTIRGPGSNAGFLAAQWKSRKHKVQGSKD